AISSARRSNSNNDGGTFYAAGGIEKGPVGLQERRGIPVHLAAGGTIHAEDGGKGRAAGADEPAGPVSHPRPGAGEPRAERGADPAAGPAGPDLPGYSGCALQRRNVESGEPRAGGESQGDGPAGAGTGS